MDSTHVDKPAPPTLDYGRQSIRRIRRRRIVRGAAALVLFSIGISVYIHRAEISLRVRRIYCFHQCMVHATPPGTVLLETNPSKAKTLLESNPDYIDPTTYAPGGMRAAQMVSSDPWRTMRAEYLPRAWRRFIEIEPVPLQQTLRGGEAINFMGQRSTPSGKQRLVVIKGSHVNLLHLPQGMQATSLVIVPPSLFEKLPRAQSVPSYQFGSRDLTMRLQPGVADPRDPTHLTLDLISESRGDNAAQRRDVLDVYLREDETLDFKLRDPTILRGL